MVRDFPPQFATQPRLDYRPGPMRALLLSPLLLLAQPALAGGAFEGVINMKITSPNGSGTVEMSVSKAGLRSVMDMQTAQMPIKMTMLVKQGKELAYMIDDKSKSYAELDLKKGREMAQKSGATFKAKKLGTETVGGYKCEHVLVTDERGGENELWTNKEIMDYESFVKLLGPNAKVGDEGLMKSLKEAGADGFIVKMVQRKSGSKDALMTMELVKVEKKSLPAALFEVPSGYTKREGPMAAMPPEVEAQLKERMKNLTPEQQEMMKKAMQQRAAGGAQ